MRHRHFGSYHPYRYSRMHRPFGYRPFMPFMMRRPFFLGPFFFIGPLLLGILLIWLLSKLFFLLPLLLIGVVVWGVVKRTGVNQRDEYGDYYDDDNGKPKGKPKRDDQDYDDPIII